MSDTLLDDFNADRIRASPCCKNQEKLSEIRHTDYDVQLSVHIAFVFVRLDSASRRGIPLWCRVSALVPPGRPAGEFPSCARV